MSSCGTCTACCKLMGVAELRKPRDVWCQHCDIGHGCRIHATRPQGCRDFDCIWLQSQARQGEAFGPELRPDRCHVVISTTADGKGLALYVDPHRPDAWRKGPIAGLIERFLNADQPVAIIVGRRMFTFKNRRLVEILMPQA